jgi:hypothetical protein
MTQSNINTPASPRNPISKRSKRLSSRTVETAKPGRYHDGAGIYLLCSKAGSKNFKFRFTAPDTHRVTELGIGSALTTTLAQARDKAHDARKLMAAGINPITASREAKIRKERQKSFGECADLLIESKRSGWRSVTHAAQWRQTLEVHAEPLWGMPVDEVGTEAVLAVLAPIWKKIPETASRFRARVEAVLDFARANKWRSGENPAWKGNLDHILTKRHALTRAHLEAMPYADVPALITRLSDIGSIPARALEFAILTAARTGEVLGAMGRNRS